MNTLFFRQHFVPLGVTNSGKRLHLPTTIESLHLCPGSILSANCFRNFSKIDLKETAIRKV